MGMKLWTTLLALPLAVVSCSDLPEADTCPAAGTINVSVGSGPKIEIRTEEKTRTELGEDGVTVTWAKDDQIALWAVNSKSEEVFGNQALKLYHYNAEYNTARFTGTVPAMAEDSYTYYAVSPAPAEASGTTAAYRIPAIQNGVFDGSCDVMVAEPITGAAALRQGDNSAAVNFRFRHMIHVLKIRIPKNSLGEKITEMTLTFPEPVAGKLSVDITDPYAAPAVTEGSNTLTLRFDKPKDAGDTVFAVIAPVALGADQPISIKAAGATRQSKPREFEGKDFSAGHTTPIAYNIPKVGPTTLRFLLADTGEETLGERIGSFTVTAPEGTDLGNGSNAHTFAVEGAGSYEIVLEDLPESLAGQTLQVAYDSENALLSDSFTIPPTLKAGGENEVATLNVPYLLFEDFDSIIEYSDHDNAGYGLTVDGITTASDLSQWGLAGWTGARTGAQAKGVDKEGSIRVCCRSQNAFGVSRYHGRLDSAPLTGIKPGKTPKIKASFNYGGGRGGNESYSPIAAYGYTTTQGKIDSKSDKNRNWYISGATEINDLPLDSNFNSIPKEKTYTIDKCSNLHRLSWEVNSTGSAWAANANSWLYIDNVKVSIVNE